ncbi:MAG: hypothetical protein IKV66_11470 [Clostridia bacterium]|nr:hypothetical protein [Clostridia bacterium]
MGVVAAGYAAVGARVLEVATARGIEIGIRAAMDYLAEEKEKARKSRYDRRLRNTRLLLKNYRSFKRHAQGAIFNAKQAKENAIDILDGLDDGMLNDNLYVEGIKKSQQRTIIILNHVEEMLRYYRIACEQSGKEEEMRRYRVIMAMYIDDDKMTAQDIAEKENIEGRTVYKDITNAIKPLSALIFGIDSIKIE